MKHFRLLACSTLMACVGSIYAWTDPVAGIEPSGTLPLLYINTEDGQVIDQKETYIDAEWWLEAEGVSDYENIGSADEPLKLGIRGRGNSSWRHEGQKPYKIKLDKKNEIMGMGKNKHFALLARLESHCLYNEVIAFEIGRQLGMPFVPQVRPVEVVINGTYMGLYFLTESIRIDDNRVEIYEQPDLNEDPETIPYGWLVEIDNNEDEFQVKIPQPQGYELWVTHKTPEQISPAQQEWLIDQMSTITELINREDRLDRGWEEYVDMDALVRHLIVQEAVTNYDAYQGSCYMNKDKDGKWNFGPLWDFNWSCYTQKDEMLVERQDQHWIGEFFAFPRFKKRLNELWNDYMEKYGTDWIEPFMEDYYNKIHAAVEQSVKVWPDDPLDAREGIQTVMDNMVNYGMDFNDNFINENCITYTINCTLNGPEDDSLELPRPVITFNGHKYDDVTLTPDMSVEMVIDAPEDVTITEVTIDGMEVDVKSLPLSRMFDNLKGNSEVVIAYEVEGYGAGTTAVELPNGATKKAIYYTPDGRVVNIDKDSKGVFIEVKGSQRKKIML